MQLTVKLKYQVVKFSSPSLCSLHDKRLTNYTNQFIFETTLYFSLYTKYKTIIRLILQKYSTLTINEECLWCSEGGVKHQFLGMNWNILTLTVTYKKNFYSLTAEKCSDFRNEFEI